MRETIKHFPKTPPTHHRAKLNGKTHGSDVQLSERLARSSKRIRGARIKDTSHTSHITLSYLRSP